MANVDWTVDRTGWAPGPWDDEPDRVEWRYWGLPCLLVRATVTGAWCGYVGVPPNHRWHGTSYNDLEGIEVHGGLTYSDACSPDSPICHVPLPGEPDDVWWFGFDCAHAWDVSPAMDAQMRKVGLPNAPPTSRGFESHYRDVPWVRAETERLADAVRAG